MWSPLLFSLLLALPANARDLCLGGECQCNGVVASCSGQDIKVGSTHTHLTILLPHLSSQLVPSQLNPRLQELTLTNTSLSILGSSQFFDYTELVTLDMSSNQIAEIAELTFRFQQQLTSLNLSHNSISTLDNLSLTGLSSLQVLDLSHNLLGEVHEGVFQSLTSVVSLKLDSNRIRSLDKRVFSSLPNLEHLSLRDNPLGPTISPQVVLPTSLLSLDLANTGLEELPTFKLPRLRSLQLSGNPLGNIRDVELANLGNLEILDLANTSLAYMPPLALLTSLIHLDLSHNQIPSVKNMAALPVLEKFSLSHNPFLVYVHTPTLENLSFLSLSHSPRLSSWTSEPLPSLTHLDLRQSAPSLPPPSLLPSITSVKLAGSLLTCDCALKPWRDLLSSLPLSSRDSPTCSLGTPLLASTFPHCASPPSSLVLGLGIGLLLLLIILAGVTFHHRSRAAILLRQVRGCHVSEEGVGYQRQTLQQEDYWLSLARRAQARPDPGTPVPVTEL